MKTKHNSHLSYCSNIHPGETWEETFANLKEYATKVRNEMVQDKTTPFGLGLRLSQKAVSEVFERDNLILFKDWLVQENMYVFTLNGFPYGSFHHTVVKDQVHTPDWTTDDRLQYTLQLADFLVDILPVSLSHGGISTSPLSYRYWFENEETLDQMKQKACQNLAEVVCHLSALKEKYGKSIHIDIEPEPDGVIETSEEFLDYYQNFLLQDGAKAISQKLDCTFQEAEAKVFEHIQLCYDVCHFAVGFESPKAVLDKMQMNNIRIGKIQISAALKGKWENDLVRSQIMEQLQKFDESTYLHQAVVKKPDLQRFQDLSPALHALPKFEKGELRTHFHVPIFTEVYENLQSTQSDIQETLQLWEETPFTEHLEVETYTWDILPASLKLDLVDSIVRELKWVERTLG